MKKYSMEIWLFVAGVLLHIASYNRPYLNLSKDGAFKLIAISYMCYMGSFYLVANTRLFKSVISIALALYFSNLLDEFFFDPYNYGWNEYLGALLSAAIGVLEYMIGWELLVVVIKNYIKKKLGNGRL